jgi:hypothetical protein
LYEAGEDGNSVAVLQALGRMGLTNDNLGTAIVAEADQVNLWLTGDSSSLYTHETSIDKLKATTLFLLRRGIFSPSTLVSWLREPNGRLGGDTPLEALAQEDGQQAVLKASTTFTRSEPPQL